MNPYLEQACQWFGALSCETASLSQYMAMFFTAAFACIVTVWLAGKIGIAIRG